MTPEEIKEHCNEIRIALEINQYEFLPRWITRLEKYTLELEKENNRAINRIAELKSALEFIPDVVEQLERNDVVLADIQQFTNEFYDAKIALCGEKEE